jgi:hypothetical protein
VHVNGQVERILIKADIIGITHTGHVHLCHTPVFRSHDLVACTMRSHDALHGGVAVYARRGMKVTLVKDLPSFGMCWVKINCAKPTFLCICYLPPFTSSYYKQHGLDLASHMDSLDSNIAAFSAKGSVLVMGDLNARTGGEDENRLNSHRRSEEGDWCAETQRIPARCNADPVVSSMGRRILQLCSDHGLVILNGRVPGDLTGSCTYYADGRIGQSAIDLCIATPGLAFTLSGEVKPGVHFQVQDPKSLPRRSHGGKFDHVPITLVLPDGPKSMQKKETSRVASTFKWRSEIQSCYVAALRAGPVREAVDLGLETNVEAIVAHFTSKITSAITEVHATAGGVIMTAKHRVKGPGRPCNKWYDDECRQARANLRQVVLTFGDSSGEAQASHRGYKKITRAKRRFWEAKEAADMLESIHHKPKRFWQAFLAKDKKSTNIDETEWQGYFQELFKSNGKAESPPRNEHVHMHACMFPNADPLKVKAATHLNELFTAKEVKAALDKAACGKAPGVDGLPVEFLKYAEYDCPEEGKVNVLLDSLTQIFNLVFLHGYPKIWAVGAIVPVPKPKGNPDSKDDYRGITVGVALSKLYSMILLQRLDAWAEKNGMRARGQAGFRHGRGTPDNAFILNNIIESCRSNKKAVFAAFIDFRKAYDCIDRSILWQSLGSMGLHGRMMETIKEMYAEVKCCVRTSGGLSECFDSDLGVKQGDPLSPLLFGLFIDRLERVILEMLPNIGIQMGHILIKLLLYADDLVLLAYSPDELQELLDMLHIFCQQNALTVNLKKCEAVIFNRRYWRMPRTRVNYAGASMDLKPTFVYLGMLFDQENGTQGGLARMLGRARPAMFGMLRRCYELNINNVHVRCRLFDALVRPILDFGCEIWGPANMAGGSELTAKHGIRYEVEKMHLGFLRQCLGVRKSVSGVVLLSELNRLPMSFMWVRQCLRFYNRIQSRSDDDFVKCAMNQNRELALGGAECWSSHLNQCLTRYNFHFLAQENNQKVSVQEVMNLIEDDWRLGGVEKLPEGLVSVRAQPDEKRIGFRLLTYTKWFAPGGQADPKSTFWYTLSSPKQISTVARFRLGSHNLCVGEHGKARSQRVCPCCDTNDREDEFHALFVCTAYSDLRMGFPGLFRIYQKAVSDGVASSGNDNMMQLCMNPGQRNPTSFWNDLSGFLIECCELRDRLISLGG